MTNTYDFLDGIHEAQDVGHVGDARDARPLRQQLREEVQPEVSGTVHGQHLERGALAPAKELPGHDVGMVLRLADQDLVAGVHEGLPEAEGDEVDGGRGAGREDDFLAEFRVQIRADGVPRGFIFGRGQRGRMMDRTVQVGVVFLRHFGPLADDAAGPLGRGRIVQIDKRFAVDRLRKGGEFLTYIFDLLHRRMQK